MVCRKSVSVTKAMLRTCKLTGTTAFTCTRGKFYQPNPISDSDNRTARPVGAGLGQVYSQIQVYLQALVRLRSSVTMPDCGEITGLNPTVKYSSIHCKCNCNTEPLLHYIHGLSQLHAFHEKVKFA